MSSQHAAESSVSVPDSGSPTGIWSQVTGTFIVSDTGVLEAGVWQGATEPTSNWYMNQGQLNAEQLYRSAVLLLRADVDATEVEALAVSLYPDAGWLGPGRLRLHGSIELRGPFTLPRPLGIEYGLPATATSAFEIVVKPDRGAALDPQAPIVDDLSAAFADGMPQGEELLALRSTLSIAQRLAGSVAVRGESAPAVVITPDPDALVNLQIYAPAWISEAELTDALRPLLPGLARPQLPSPSAFDPAPFMGEEASPALIRQARAETAAYQEYMSGIGSQTFGYQLRAAAGHSSHVVVALAPTQMAPQALRFELWASRPMALYTVVWQPQFYDQAFARRLSRVMRVERLRVTTVIEQVAAVIARLSGGIAIDDAGFIVSL
ncbi:MAG: hypothetical protein SOS98_05510 [Varibaculum sp.]|nr:hypothetical protein [Varibaculum sp.]